MHKKFKYNYFEDDRLLLKPKIKDGYYYRHNNRHQYILKFIDENCPKNAKILDLASSTGILTLRLAKNGYRVTWNDIRSELLDYVMKKGKKYQNISYELKNLFELKNDRYDCVVAGEIIEHVAHPDRLVKKIFKMLKPGGVFICSTPNGDYFRNIRFPKWDAKKAKELEKRQFGPDAPDHLFLLNEQELSLFCKKAKFFQYSFSYINNPLTAGNLKLNSIVKILPEKLVFFLEKIFCKLPNMFKKHFSCTIIVVAKKLP